MTGPLVSVICLCYNHARFVSEALNSVITQSYGNLQIIVVDDASKDNSASIISDILVRHPEITFLALEQNNGNCKAFNRGLALAEGEFIIDFATDDVMLPDKIEKQVNLFRTLDQDYGVVFTDAEYISTTGTFMRNHYEYLFRKRLLTSVFQGDVYDKVLSTYFIASPSMMIRKSVFDYLKGYDENLSYEDFDFWVRSARKFKYAFLNEITVRIRKSERSMSTGWYVQGDNQLHSTYLVCLKAVDLNKSEADWEALATRLKYEIRQSVFSENMNEAQLFYDLLKRIKKNSISDSVFMSLGKLHLPLSFVRRFYHKVRYN
jgi:glycosyltransferase involved in cell wall biosynthesis